jgi:DinB family protein
MSRTRVSILAPALVAAASRVLAQQPAPAPAAAPSIASVVDGQISAVEKLIGEAAEAMPEEKWGFSPAGLSIPGSEYDGVRTFALQVRHVAASNYALWASVTRESIPDDWKGGNGPDSLKTKAQILKFLGDSFALGHRAAASLTTGNALEPVAPGKSARLDRATFAVAHAYDHYGQMVEYLRMNGIVPPATKRRSSG